MFSDDFGVEFGLPPLAQGRLPFHLNLYVPDADATWAAAVAAGWRSHYAHRRPILG
jgi:hypothetical protein